MQLLLKQKTLYIFSALFFISACNNSISTPPTESLITTTHTRIPVAAATATSSSTPTDVPTSTHTPAPTATSTNQPTSTPSPTQIATDMLLSIKSRNENLAQSLIDLWHTQSDIASVDATIKSYDWVRPIEWTSLDLNGDGFDEWLVTVPFFSLEEMAPCACNPGDFWIINGDGRVYQVSNSDSKFLVAPSTLTQVDMTGDNLPDVIVTSKILGAHTTTTTYYVISAHHGRVENIIRRGNKLDLISNFFRPAEGFDDAHKVHLSNADQEITDATGDGLPNLVLSGGTFNSIGAGFGRRRTEVWGWDGDSITLVNIQWEQTNFQPHVLIDAEFSFALGDYETAIAQYEQVIYDDTLQDDAMTPQNHDQVRQYAAFRLVFTYLKLGNSEEALFWHNWLGAEYPDSSTTNSVNLLFESWQESANLTEACEVVTRFLENYDGPTIYIYTGYANPILSSETLCQFQ